MWLTSFFAFVCCFYSSFVMFFFGCKIDARILRTVAREHPTNADEAAAVVVSEVVPLFPQEWEDHVKKRKLSDLPLCKGTCLFHPDQNLESLDL